MEQVQPLTVEKVDQILGKCVREAFLREEQLSLIIRQQSSQIEELKTPRKDIPSEGVGQNGID